MQQLLGKRGGLASVALCAAALSLTALVAAPVHAQHYVGQVVANGLLNPRGLTFGPDGTLYIAEAGSGGNGATIGGGEGAVSYGATGAITTYKNGVQTRILTGLPSLASQTGDTPGGSASGLTDLTFGGDGRLYGIIGLGANPAERATLTAGGAPGENFGRLARFTPGGSPTVEYLADIAAFEAANNPDGGAEPDSNPYGLTATPDGFAVTDAGGNTLIGVGADNLTTSLLAVLPQSPNPIFDPANPATGGPFYEHVPTGVAQGAGGTLYVAGLSGYPFPVGGANIYTVSPGGTVGVVPGGGFTNLIDLIYSPTSNSLYALQLTTNGLASPTGPGPGQLIKVNPITGERTVLYNGLFFPGGVAQGADGAFYVTNLSVAAGGGSVIRITAAPEPGSLGLIASALLVAGAGLVRRRA